MFNPTKIECLLGGDFTLKGESLVSANDLAALFRLWASEVDEWEDKPLSEVAILNGRISVTLKNGVFGV